MPIEECLRVAGLTRKAMIRLRLHQMPIERLAVEIGVPLGRLEAIFDKKDVLKWAGAHASGGRRMHWTTIYHKGLRMVFYED